MDNIQMDELGINMVLGSAMPFVLDFLTRFFGVKSSRKKSIFTFLVAVGIGVVLNAGKIFSGDYANLMLNVSTVLITSQKVYDTLWKKSQTREKVLQAFDEGREAGKK